MIRTQSHSTHGFHFFAMCAAEHHRLSLQSHKVVLGRAHILASRHASRQQRFCTGACTASMQGCIPSLDQLNRLATLFAGGLSASLGHCR